MNMALEQVDKIWTNPLSGKVLAAAMGELPRFTMIFWNATGNGTNEYGGSLYEELLWLSLSLNFSLEMKPLRNSAFGSPTINGSWDGMKGMLQRKEIDIAVSALSGVAGSNLVMDLGAYTNSEEYIMVTQYPSPRSFIYGHIVTFSPGVWLGLLISMIVMIASIKLLDIFGRNFFHTDDNQQGSSSAVLSNLSNISEYIFATLTNHGGYYKATKHRSLGVMAATWCFATFVFVNVYCSCLTVYMSLVFQRPDINSIRDLVENPNYQLMTVIGSTAELKLLDPQAAGFLKQAGEKLLKCPFDACRTSDNDKAIQKVLDEKNFVTFFMVTLAKNWMYKTFSKGTCHLTLAQYKMASTNYFMGCTKDGPYCFPLFKASLTYHAFGLNYYWTKEIMPDAPQCQLKYNQQGECVNLVNQARLKVEQFYIAFAVLFGGYILSLLQFIRERFTRF